MKFTTYTYVMSALAGILIITSAITGGTFFSVKRTHEQYQDAFQTFNSGRYDKALPRLQTLVKDGIERSDVYAAIGRIHYENGDINKAQQAYKQADELSTEPRRKATFAMQAAILSTLKGQAINDKAIKTLDAETINHASQDPNMAVYRGVLQAWQGEYSAASKTLKSALNGRTLVTRANVIEGYSALATSYAQLGKAKEALAVLDQLDYLDPGNDRARQNRGGILLKSLGKSTKNIDDIAESAERVIQSLGNDHESLRLDILTTLGCAYFHKDNLTKAKAYFAKARRLKDSSTLKRYTVYTQIKLKEPVRDIVPLLSQLADEAKSNAKRRANDYALLGALQLNDPKRSTLISAQKSFERALKQNPEQLLALQGLAAIRLYQSRFQEARDLAKRVDALKQDTPWSNALTTLSTPPSLTLSVGNGKTLRRDKDVIVWVRATSQGPRSIAGNDVKLQLGERKLDLSYHGDTGMAILPRALKDGDLTISAKAVDIVGNEGASRINFQRDTGYPTINLKTPSPNVRHTSVSDIILHVEDATSGVLPGSLNAVLKPDKGTPPGTEPIMLVEAGDVRVNGSWKAPVLEVSKFGTLAGGDWWLRVDVKDHAGNASSRQFKLRIKANTPAKPAATSGPATGGTP